MPEPLEVVATLASEWFLRQSPSPERTGGPLALTAPNVSTHDENRRGFVSRKRSRTMKTDWMTRGKCRDLPWDAFFPRDGMGVSTAQKICATCPVSQDCLEYALENHIAHGVWGGCSERERRRILRRRRSELGVAVA